MAQERTGFSSLGIDPFGLGMLILFFVLATSVHFFTPRDRAAPPDGSGPALAKAIDDGWTPAAPPKKPDVFMDVPGKAQSTKPAHECAMCGSACCDRCNKQDLCCCKTSTRCPCKKNPTDR